MTSTNREGGSTIGSGVINLTNTIVGAGMLGLPGAMGSTGWLSGILIIVISAAFSAHGLVLLSKAACLTGRPSSFYSVALASVPRFTILIDAAVALKCFGVATGYLVTISSSMVKAMEYLLQSPDPADDDRYEYFNSLLLSRQIWVIGAMMAALPFSFYRTLDDLKKASALALIFVFVLVWVIIAYANGGANPCENDDDDELTCRGDVVPFTNFASTVSRLPIFVFAFTCHHNIFPIVNEMELLSQRRLNIVISCSIGFALVIYSIVALEGYQTYGSLVRGDILLNYPENMPVTVLRICIAFMLTLHYPLQLDPGRRCISSLVKVVLRWCHQKKSNRRNLSEYFCNPELERQESDESIEEEQSDGVYAPMEMSHGRNPQEECDDRIFYSITILFLALSFLLATIVDDLGVILALVGATGSTLVSYVLPGLMYIKVYPNKDASLVMAHVQLLLGIVIMPLALYFIVTEKLSH
ncbi:hypothetical protein ACHAWU_007239 [Discostella pseudostelligera]|uniref:Amino acid transporter transmembrane domain-containing protein n=1 Tax=Discostella pseudostelligera TaxID=259834 RepID=A0ABD3LX10_9STRA